MSSPRAAAQCLQSVRGEREESVNAGGSLLGWGHMGRGADLETLSRVLCHTVLHAKTEHILSDFPNLVT